MTQGKHWLDGTSFLSLFHEAIEGTYERQTGVDAEQAGLAIETRHAGRGWEVIVEPDGALSLLVVVTAFAVWES